MSRQASYPTIAAYALESLAMPTIGGVAGSVQSMGSTATKMANGCTIARSRTPIGKPNKRCRRGCNTAQAGWEKARCLMWAGGLICLHGWALRSVCVTLNSPK